MNVYTTVRQMIRMLNAAEKTLDKAFAYADSKKFDAKVLLEARLIADQFPLKRQIQIATDTAKGMAGRLSQKEVPAYEDNEQTPSELKARIQKTVAYLETFKDGDFENYQNVKVTFHFMPGKSLTGKDFYEQMAVPNFYFHLTTAYSILRANGVPIGKYDFLPELPLKDE